MSTALVQLSGRLKVSEQELTSIVMNTVMPNRGQQVTTDQFLSFITVANEYKLNPLIKEIYAFPAKGGGIQAIVSIDGWLKIINTHPEFDGMEHEDIMDNGQLVAIKCLMYRKDTSRPVTVTEYMNECRRNTDTWKTWPARMLRHKATIQAARYAFGISGIVDPDEAERFSESSKRDEREVNPAPQERDITPKTYAQADFEQNFPKWEALIQSGKRTPEQIIGLVSTKGELSDSQIEAINSIEAGETA